MLFLPQVQPGEPAEYHQIAAGPDRRWYRPLIAVAVYVPTFILLMTVVASIGAFIDGDPAQFAVNLKHPDSTDPILFGTFMLIIAMMIPAAILAAVLGMRMRPGYLFSVEGRLRWKWQLVAYGTCFLLMTAILTPLFMLDDIAWNTPPNIAVLLFISLVLVPLQSAGEEIVFRGAILQMFGSWIPHRWISLAVGTLASALVFASLHNSLDVWILLELAVFASASVFLTWYTGGLEAAIGYHAANNAVVFTLNSIRGSNEAFIVDDTAFGPGPLLMGSLLILLNATVLVFVSKRMGLNRRHDPTKRPDPDTKYLMSNLARGRYFPRFAHLYPEHVRASYKNQTRPGPTSPDTGMFPRQ